MNFMDMLQKAGGTDSLGSLAKGLGLESNQVNDLVGALSPALMRSVQKQAEADGGVLALKKALGSGNHQRYLDNPDLMADSATRKDGNNILGHLFGSKDVSRNVAAQAAQSTGIDTDLIKKALPLLASLAMGALSKSSNGGRSLGDSLPGLLGSAVGDDGDFGLDDLLGLAKKLF
jgi:hypothetical protein